MLPKGPVLSTMMVLVTLLFGYHFSQPPRETLPQEARPADPVESEDPLFQRLKEGFEKNPRRSPSEILMQVESTSPAPTQPLPSQLPFSPANSALADSTDLSEAEWEAMEHLLSAARLLQSPTAESAPNRTVPRQQLAARLRQQVRQYLGGR